MNKTLDYAHKFFAESGTVYRCTLGITLSLAQIVSLNKAWQKAVKEHHLNLFYKPFKAGLNESSLTMVNFLVEYFDLNKDGRKVPTGRMNVAVRIKPDLKRIPDDFTDLWESMTDENQHFEVRIAISEFFGLQEFVDYFKSVKRTAELQHHLSRDDRDIYYKMSESLISIIRDFYGDKIAEQVGRTL